MLREHYQRNLPVGARAPATDRIYRALEDPENPRATIWIFPLHAPPIDACGLGKRGRSVTPLDITTGMLYMTGNAVPPVY